MFIDMKEKIQLAFEDLEGKGMSHYNDSHLAEEGLARTLGGEIVRDYSDAYREIKGWVQGIKSKRKDINELCLETIEWLEDKNREHSKLELDAGKIKTWLKTDKIFTWRFYFLLNDDVYKDIVKQIKDGEISQIEDMVDFDLKGRAKVTRMLSSVKTVPDLIVIVEKYRSRADAIFGSLLSRERKMQGFPFQVMLLGYNDLNRTVKRIVNLAV